MSAFSWASDTSLVTHKFSRKVENSRRGAGDKLEVVDVQHDFHVGCSVSYAKGMAELLRHYGHIVRTGIDFYQRLMVYWAAGPLSDAFSRSHLGKVSPPTAGLSIARVSAGEEGRAHWGQFGVVPGPRKRNAIKRLGWHSEGKSVGTLQSWLGFPFPPKAGRYASVPPRVENFLENAIRYHQTDAVHCYLSTILNAIGMDATREIFASVPHNDPQISILSVAAFYGRSGPLIQSLLRVFPSPDLVLPDTSGRRALYLASQVHKNEAVIRALHKAGANLDIKQNAGWTPLTNAADEGNITAIETLLDLGAKVDLPTGYGMSPLHLAAFGCFTETVEVLLSYGANPAYQCPKSGETALDHCARETWWDKDTPKKAEEQISTIIVLVEALKRQSQYRDQTNEQICEDVLERGMSAETKALMTKMASGRSEQLACLLNLPHDGLEAKREKLLRDHLSV